MSLPKVFLKSGEDHRVRAGHLWVFSNEIERTEGTVHPGEIADLHDHRKKFLARGFYNPHSLISFRILTRQDVKINSEFFAREIQLAERLRSQVYPGEKSYRIVYGESDGFPGLVIDRFGDHFVSQSYCLGMDLLFPMVLEGLKKNFKAGCVIQKNDVSARELEGLKQEVTVVEGELSVPLQIEQPWGEVSLKFFADPIEGQKTGFFFDQRRNRECLARFAKGKRVLDCFSYGGGFGIYAAKAGAGEVLSVDSSEKACGAVRTNADLNQVRVTAICEDVDEALERFRNEKQKFDIIVLDPPALAKSKKNLFGALRKYQKLNEAAIGLLKESGILMSCSCSHHVGHREFIEMIGQAAQAQGWRARLLEFRGQAPDHPLLPAMPETEYLKCAVIGFN